METFVPTGRALVVAIVGHPVGQVRSPAVLNAELAQLDRRGHDSGRACAAALATFVTVFVPGPTRKAPSSPSHKSSAVALVDTLTARARLLGAVNMVRRAADGGLHGEWWMDLGSSRRWPARNRRSWRSVAIFGGGAVGRPCCWRSPKRGGRDDGQAGSVLR